MGDVVTTPNSASRNAESRVPLWWHVYGHVVPTGDLAGCWQMVTAGGVSVGPDEEMPTGGTPRNADPGGMPWLASFDHEPTPAELDAVTPEGYRDDV